MRILGSHDRQCCVRGGRRVSGRGQRAADACVVPGGTASYNGDDRIIVVMRAADLWLRDLRRIVILQRA